MYIVTYSSFESARKRLSSDLQLMSESHSDHEILSGEDVDVGQFVSKRRLVTSESAFFVKKLVEVFTKEKKAKHRFKVSRPYDRDAEISGLQVSCFNFFFKFL